MRILLVLDHPYTLASATNVRHHRSFSAAVAAAIRGATDAGHHVDVIDLAAEDFHPTMTREDLAAWRQTGIIDPQASDYQHRLAQAEHLVFAFPMSWEAMPAATKGDRVHDDPPNLITNVATTDASVPDTVMTAPIHHDLAGRGVLAGEHYLDSGYPSADLLVSSLTDYGVRLVTPMLADTSPQARAAEGYDRSGFTIDWPTRTVTCPQGNTSTWWTPTVQRGTDVIVVTYAGADCQPCPVKTKCTTATRGGRQLTLRPQPVQHALDTARAEQTTTQWQTRYARRAGVERLELTPAA